MNTPRPSRHVILLHPDLERLGGIETHILKLKRHLKTPAESVVLARRPGESGPVPQLKRLLGDYRNFGRVLRKYTGGVVHVNPSLDSKGFFREGFYVRKANAAGFRTLVFFHGWGDSMARRLDQNPAVFRFLYGKADAFVVLARAFEDRLRSWGVTQPIHREVTTVDDSFLVDYDFEARLLERRARPRKQIVFAGRILREKGVLRTILAMEQLAQWNVPADLVVLGDGPDLEEARRLASSRRLPNVRFAGRVSPTAMTDYYSQASIFCFPTAHPEGLPSVLVEAMAHGVPVITTPVGGIVDVIRSPQNGVLLQDLEPQSIARALRELIEDPEASERVARENFEYARRTFRASEAAARMDRLYQELLQN